MQILQSHPYNLSKYKQRNQLSVQIDESIKTEKEWQQFYYEERHKTALSNLYLNAIELDKLLLAFNVGALAFTITLLLGIDFNKFDIFEKIAVFFGIIATFVSVSSIYYLLEVFTTNVPYLNARIEDNLDLESEYRSKLNQYDSYAREFFFCSMVFIVLFLIFMLLHNIYFPAPEK